MPLLNLIRSNLTFDTQRTPRDGFGKPMIASVHSLFMERAQTVSTRQELIDFGFSTSGSVIGMFDVLMGQDFRPRSVSIGRRATPVAQIVAVNITGSDDGSYVVTINGVDFTFAASSDDGSAIEAGLISAINGGTEPVTASAGTGDQLLLTADVAGVPFTVEVDAPNDNLNTSESVASVGIYDDYQAIKEYDSSWYAALSDDRSTPMILEAARWAQSERVLNVAQTDEAAVLDPDIDTDVASQLLALQRSRTMLLYKSNDTHYLDAAIVGKQLPKVPGTSNWAWQAVRGVTADELTQTQVEALRAKRCGWVEDMGGEPTHFEGATSAAGMWVDLVRGGDKIRNDIDSAKVDALKGAEKIGFDELAILESAIEGAIRRNNIFVLADSVQVELPEEIEESDISARRVLGIEWKATIRTPVNEVESNGELTISGVV